MHPFEGQERPHEGTELLLHSEPWLKLNCSIAGMAEGAPSEDCFEQISRAFIPKEIFPAVNFGCPKWGALTCDPAAK